MGKEPANWRPISWNQDPACSDRNSGFSCEQFQEESSWSPEEETLEALADALKLTKGDIRARFLFPNMYWFFKRQCETMLKQFSKAHENWEM